MKKRPNLEVRKTNLRMEVRKHGEVRETNLIIEVMKKRPNLKVSKTNLRMEVMKNGKVWNFEGCCRRAAGALGTLQIAAVKMRVKKCQHHS